MDRNTTSCIPPFVFLSNNTILPYFQCSLSFLAISVLGVYMYICGEFNNGSMCLCMYEAFLSSDRLARKKDESEPAIKWRKTWRWYCSLWFPCFLNGLHSHCKFLFLCYFAFLLIFHFTQFNQSLLCLDTRWIGGTLLGQERFSVSRRSIVGSLIFYLLLIFLYILLQKTRVHGFNLGKVIFVRKQVIEYPVFWWVSPALWLSRPKFIRVMHALLGSIVQLMFTIEFLSHLSLSLF